MLPLMEVKEILYLVDDSLSFCIRNKNGRGFLLIHVEEEDHFSGRSTPVGGRYSEGERIPRFYLYLG